MTAATRVPLSTPNRCYIGGEWVAPSSDATIEVIFGGFKQSGIGREGGREGLVPYLETKLVVLNGVPGGYR